MIACPRCSSTNLVSRGTESHSVLVVRDGRIVEVRGTSQRMTCKSCGKTSSHREDGLVDASYEARELIVETVHRLGQTAASAELGVPRSTVQRHLARWREAREPEIVGAAPIFLLVDVAHVRGADRVLVVDLDRETLVEMLEGHDQLAGWIGEASRAPAVRVCMGLDPKLASIVRTGLPSAEVMVAPSTMRRAVRTEAILATRALRRSPDLRGRNGMPFPQEMAEALREDRPTPEPWPLDAGAVLTAARAALHLLDAKDRAGAEAAWPQFEMAVALAPMPRLARLFSTWREPILAGVDHRFVDRASLLVAKARRALATRRPSLGFQDLRGFALMDGFEMALEGLPIPGASQTPVSVGRPLVGLLEALAT